MLELSFHSPSVIQVFKSLVSIGAPVSGSVDFRENLKDLLTNRKLTYILLRRDKSSAILLYCGLDNVRREAVSRQVHQGVRCRDVLRDPGFLSTNGSDVISRSDGEHKSNAKNDSKQGGSHVEPRYEVLSVFQWNDSELTRWHVFQSWQRERRPWTLGD